MSIDFLALANPGVEGLHPYQPGKPVEELERELGISNSVKLASNENPLGLGPKARAAIERALPELARYPDANGFALKAKLADKLGVHREQLILGNGSNELIDLVFHTFVSPGQQVVYSQYTFIVYALATQAHGAEAVVVPARDFGHDLEAMAAAITPATRLVCITNPNNPTGTFVGAAEIQAFMDKVPAQVLVVLDEAYTEYVAEDERIPSIDWLARYPNLIVSRTFSKAYGLAGLRVGYMVCHPELVAVLNRVREPFNCNSLALAAAEAALDDEDYLNQAVELNRREMARYEAFFQEQGLKYIPSRANFITLDLQREAGPVYEALLREGVIVRPIAGYGLPTCLRISIGLEHENQRCLEALAKVLG
ncbi:histidinol-phosphate transaminase [Zobellella denitrificans]|uniref:Histidinol-phosphate aminotransferase n=1 Tax=Zobellella denitrificans TaxID=347534 RepID=A0A291HQT0_9GAMM|nr:histidinol-phosphate transaminase [Zobellella denitrificans]ATG74469.1 aspartate aminotransferase [Zobellella denitrificans]